jgi:cytochrome P450
MQLPKVNLSVPIATYKMIKTPYKLLTDCYKEYGDIFSLKTLSGDFVFVSDLDVIKDIFSKHSKKFNTGETVLFLEPFVGNHSLLLLDGVEHARHRKLLTPHFHGEKMKMFTDMMYESAHKMVDKWKVGQKLMIRQEMQEITLRVIVKSVFGEEMSKRTPEIIETVRGVLQLPTLLTFLPFLRFNLGKWSAWGKFLTWREKIDKLIFEEIDRRRANPRPQPQDVVDMMMLSQDESGNFMTDKEIRDECLTLLFAGHETTALSLTWIFIPLLQNPNVLKKLLAEINSVVGDNPITPEMIPKLTYLDATIKESMRVNNLFPIVARKTIEPLELKGYEIPVGATVAPCNMILHHLDSIYPEPLTFRPERFLEESNSHPYSWLPFGGGNRRCIGMAFALYEMKIILASILPRIELELIPGQDFRAKRLGLALAPPTGVKVNVLSLKPAPSQVLELVH